MDIAYVGDIVHGKYVVVLDMAAAVAVVADVAVVVDVVAVVVETGECLNPPCCYYHVLVLVLALDLDLVGQDCDVHSLDCLP